MGSENTLYYGDNLDVLRRYIQDETVDLIYLDPPFKSNADYNILFKEHSGNQSAAQIKAFEDTWSWDAKAEEAYFEASYSAPDRVFQTLKALREILGSSDMMAYLVMMTLRLIELHRVLRPTGSLFLHCDSTASHYLKIILDSLFGIENFRNEIVWKRANTVKGNFGQGSRKMDPNTDTILYYSKTRNTKYFQQFASYSEDYVKKNYRHIEPETGRKYQLISMTGPGGASKGNPEYEVFGIKRYWRYSFDKMQKLIADGMVVQTSPGAVPRRKLYLDEGLGVPIQTLWDDIKSLSANDSERLGYPTQKPVSLLERIVNISTEVDEVVLDPFCGCGTAVVAAQKLNRRWIGIDITHLAVNLIRTRMVESFGEDAKFKVIGEPTDLMSAMTLAEEDRYQFQFWALGLVNARPAASNQKKGADGGIDGKIHFRDDMSGNIKTIIISVKSGKTSVTHIRELISVVDREKAVIGVYITLQDPTSNMAVEALEAGYYESEAFGAFPKIQILSIKQLLEGVKIKFPSQLQRVDETFKKSNKVTRNVEQGKLDF